MISDMFSKQIKKAQFDFSGKYKYIALFTNPAYFVRKNLYYGIKEYSKLLKGKVLDFGCGAKPYRNLFINCEEYIGCDIEISGHNHSNEIIDVFYDGKKLPFEDNTFDSIFSSEVFEHVDDLEGILLELKRVLKSNGTMLITVPFVWKEHEVPYDFRRLTSYGLNRLLKEAGFTIVSQKKLTNSFETILQLWISYIRECFQAKIKNRSVRIIFQRIVISPMIMCGIIIGLFFPRNDNLYTDNLIFCKKI